MTDPVQPLFALDLAPAEVERRAALDGRHTVARFKADRPHAYQLILQRLQEGCSFNAITREFRDHGHPLHESTLSLIARSAYTEKQLRDFRAAAFAKGARVAVDIATDHLVTAAEEVDQIPELPARAKARIQLASVATVTAGVFNQNAELLGGNPTVIVAEHDVIDHDRLKDMLAQARQRAAIPPARDITAEATASPSPGVFTPSPPSP